MLPDDLPQRLPMPASSSGATSDSSATKNIQTDSRRGSMVAGQEVSYSENAQGSSGVTETFKTTLGDRIGKMAGNVATLHRRLSRHLGNEKIRVHVGDVFGSSQMLRKFTLPYPKGAVLSSSSEISSEKPSGGVSKFNALLKNKHGFEALMTYCEERHCEENPHFLLSINELKSLLSKGKVNEAREVFDKIHEIFFKDEAPLGVNLLDLDKQALLDNRDLSSPEFMSALIKAENHIKGLIGNNTEEKRFETLLQGYVKK